MTLYCGIDLHSNNSFVTVINDMDKRLLEKRIDNDRGLIIQALKRYRARLKAVAIESTFNWYWLADALEDAGFKVQLVNTARIVQYEGLKCTDDRYDAFHLAHLMRLGILPTGHIYPRADRGLRDLLRKRMFLVQDRSRHIIWNYVVNNYLMGNKPPAFDILYWNNDTTNLPARLHSDFLDQIQSNPLVNAGDLSIMDQPIDLTSVACDKYLVAGTTDHITPWHACYRSTQFLGGDIRFVLSNSGHIQALVNPPGNPRANYFVNEELPASHDEWLEGAQQCAGSWWEDWAGWLQQRSGRKVNARKALGRKGSHEPMESAPGTYVY